ncbi:MAG: hypothetical protein GY863_08390 [bacterium]|nr:hypothetical protein [bacterium]
MTQNNINSELDFISLLRLLFKYKKSIILFTSFFLICGIAYIFIATPVYTASISILPSQEMDSSAQLSRLQSLTSALPFMSMSATGDLSQVYPAILTSKTLLYMTLDSTFADPDNGESKTLLDWLEIEIDDRAQALDKAYEKLDDLIDVELDNASSLITLSISFKYPWLAAGLCEMLSQMLNNFSVEYKTSSAKNTRQFTQEQLSIQGDSLESAEINVRDFIKTNINYLEDADLRMRYQELERERLAREQIWIEYRQQYELARLQEVKDTPVLTILDKPIIPVKPSKPRKLLVLALSMAMGFLLACFSVIIVDKFFQAEKP